MEAPARILELERQLHWAQLKIQALEEELRQQRIAKLGPKSETLSNLQLELLCESEPSTTRDEVEAEAKRAPLPNLPEREPKRKSHPGRKPLPEKLPRVEEVLTCANPHCAKCLVAPVRMQPSTGSALPRTATACDGVSSTTR